MQEFSPPYGEIETLSPLIRRITANNPAPYTFKGTGTFIVGHGTVAVIDPGPDMPDHINAIMTSLKGEEISHILVTHNHKDHSPGSDLLSELSGAKIYAFDVGHQKYSEPDLEEGLDKNFKPDVILNDGDFIEGESWTIEAVHTPGHLSNHLCFSLHQEKALFTGDHVMGWSTTIVSPPDGNMQDYLNSLEKMMLRDDEIYYPTHGIPIEKPMKFIRQLFAHRLRRDKEIIRAMENGAHTVEDMLAKVYPKIKKELHVAASRTIFAHLIRLVDLGEVKCVGAVSESARYHPTK